jgi:murein hydrolase activator
MARTQVLLVALLLSGASALAKERSSPRSGAGKERRTARRVAGNLLRSEHVSVLRALEHTGQATLLHADSLRAVTWQLWSLQKELPRPRELRTLPEDVAAIRWEDLQPRRQKVEDRMRHGLALVPSSREFALLLGHARSQGTLSGIELQALEGIERARSTQLQTVAELARLLESFTAEWETLDETRRKGGARQALANLRALVRVQRQEAHRLIRELERARRELATWQEELKAGPDTSGFGALLGKLPRPAEGHIEVGFGEVLNPRFNTVTLHKGVDIRAPAGSPVRAVAPGRVVHAGWLRGYGNLLILEHEGNYHTLMAHLERLACEPGQSVEAGQHVGTVGDTDSRKGPYLYFEIRRHGEAVNPTDWLLPL